MSGRPTLWEIGLALTVTPEEYEGADRLQLNWDLGRAFEKETKQAIKAWCEKLPQRRQLRWLSIWSLVTRPLFDVACRIENLDSCRVPLVNAIRT